MHSGFELLEATLEVSAARSLKRIPPWSLEGRRSEASRPCNVPRSLRAIRLRSAGRSEDHAGKKLCCPFSPSWPSCSNESGVQETLAPSQIELNEARKASRPFPMGLSLMILTCCSVRAILLAVLFIAEKVRLSVGT